MSLEFKTNINELEILGYTITSKIYTDIEIEQIISCIENSKKNEKTFSKTKNLFAIRQLINTIPELKKYLFNTNLTKLIASFSNNNYFLTKAIYFDKPKESNWFVAYHQDLSISVNKKTAKKDYINWTYKKGQYGVQPPTKILKDTITIRIHLDDTNKNNGALKVIPKSHLNGIVRVNSKDWCIKNEHLCEVKKGETMLMKPLTIHASNKTTNNKQRRVIHLEFCNQNLEKPLNWLEKYEINLTD